MLILGVEMDEGGRTTSSKVALAPGAFLVWSSPRVGEDTTRVRRLSTEHWTRFIPCDMLLARLPGWLLGKWSLLTEWVSLEREWDVADLGMLVPVEQDERRVAARSISVEVVGMLPRRWYWEARCPWPIERDGWWSLEAVVGLDDEVRMVVRTLLPRYPMTAASSSSPCWVARSRLS